MNTVIAGASPCRMRASLFNNKGLRINPSNTPLQSGAAPLVASRSRSLDHAIRVKLTNNAQDTYSFSHTNFSMTLFATIPIVICHYTRSKIYKSPLTNEIYHLTT